MTEESDGIDNEKAKSLFENAVQYVGREWFIESYREYYGEEDGADHQHQRGPPELITQYARALEELGYQEPKAPEILPADQISEPTLRMINLARYASNLENIETYYADSGEVRSGLDNLLINRLKGQEYEKAFFEIQVAAGYARQDLPIQFVEERGVKTSDIRIPIGDTTIYIECKRVDRKPGSAQKRSGLYEVLFGQTSNALDREGIVVFDLDRLPSIDEAQNITEHLPENTGDSDSHEIEIPYGTIRIYPFLEPGKDKEIVKSAPQPMLEFQTFTDLEVVPILRTKFDDDFEKEDIDNATIEAESTGNDVVMKWRKPLFMGSIIDSSDDYIKPVLNQIDSARAKFSKSMPNIVHVDIPNLDNFSEDEIRELRRRIGGKLKVNTRINAVCVSTEIFETLNDSIGFRHFMLYIENWDPATELPPDFKLPGESFEYYIDKCL